MNRLPEDVTKIITEFAYNVKLDYFDLYTDCERCDDIQDNVPDIFLNLLVYDTHSLEWVPSPFRACYPYFPSKYLDKYTFWSKAMNYIPGSLELKFFRREKTYRSVFARHIHQMHSSGFRTFNTLLARYFSRIQRIDLPDDPDFNHLLGSLQQARPILKPS